MNLFEKLTSYKLSEAPELAGDALGKLWGGNLPVHDGPEHHHGPLPPDGIGTPSTRADVVIFSPHPDDEALACSGAIVEALEAGQQVRVIFMTSGERCYPVSWKPGIAQLREQESCAVAEKMGLDPENDILFLRYPDAGLGWLWRKGELVKISGCQAAHPAAAYRERFRSRTLVARLQHILRAWAPSTVYIPHSQDSHPDHWATGLFARKAIEGLPASTRPRLLSYLVHYTHVYDGRGGNVDTLPVPDAYQDESDWLLPGDSVLTPPEGVLGSAIEYEPNGLWQPTGGVTTDFQTWKSDVIRLYASQYSPYLALFARPNEVFWEEEQPLVW